MISCNILGNKADWLNFPKDDADWFKTYFLVGEQCLTDSVLIGLLDDEEIPEDDDDWLK